MLVHCSFIAFFRDVATYVVVARVDVEVGREGHGGAEEEDGVEEVNHNHQQRVQAEILLQCRGDEVEEGEEGEDRQEDQVVDD